MIIKTSWNIRSWLENTFKNLYKTYLLNISFSALAEKSQDPDNQDTQQHPKPLNSHRRRSIEGSMDGLLSHCPRPQKAPDPRPHLPTIYPPAPLHPSTNFGCGFGQKESRLAIWLGLPLEDWRSSSSWMQFGHRGTTHRHIDKRKTHHESLMKNHQLPVTRYQLPDTSCHLPVASSQLPASGRL